MIISYFPDVHMGLGHQGLSDLARKHKRSVDKLEAGDFLLFMNRSQTAFKLYAAGNVIAYYKSTRGRIEPSTITMLPKYFNGTRIDYDGALKEAVEKSLRRKR